MFVGVENYRRGEPLPEKPKSISFNLKYAFAVAVITTGMGMLMAQGAKISGPYIMASGTKIPARRNENF
jgi:hypothetical protein